jgi:hypothetical protein
MVGFAFAFVALTLLGCRNEPIPEDSFVKQVMAFPSRMKEWDQKELATKLLLETYKPRVYIAPESYLPINFYQDYVPNCVVRSLKNRRGIVHDHIDKALLNRIKEDLDLYLDYGIPADEALTFTSERVTPTIYGRIYSDILESGGKRISLTFLKYSLVFPYSGLAAKTKAWKSFGSRIIGDPKAWHELDIHGAIHIILAGDDKRPIGVLLAQHNHHRVFLIGRDIEWPADNRISVSIAQYSNEPYLLPKTENVRLERVVGNPMHIEYLFGLSDRVPIDGGMDKVFSPDAGAREVSLQMELLPTDDALYTAWIPLGDRIKVFGFWETWYMRGPPGIDFYTLGPLKNLGDLMAFWFIDPKDRKFFELVKEHIRSIDDYNFQPILAHQKERLFPVLHALMNTTR